MLESYIAPLFTGYVDKYIKNLKPEDLSLSLWGGDLVLQNLEINLDVIQQELNLPVEFLSGKIHKFQLHVPWTRLIYDPVVITINTMEFIVKLKDPTDTVVSPPEKPTEEEVAKEPELDTSTNTEDLPPGYVQGILNKVINNVSFQIHNIIIKYVEDDIVFSLNIKSLDFHSSDEDWNAAFIDLKLPELLLRKVCEISDLTICLDQRNPSGKIELYHDPVLYKCNLTCRIVSQYKGLSSTIPYENTLNVYCESFDFSFTDHQIPMVIRLINLIIGLYYGTLDLPGCNVKLHTAPKVLDQYKQEQSRKSSNVLDNSTEDVSSESWTSWAMSMVPGMAAVTEENKSSVSKLDMKTTIGVYITLVTVTLKRTNQSSDSVIAHQRLEFSPVLCMEVCGCVIECIVVGDLLFDLNLGLQSVVGYTVGNQCVCSMLSPLSQGDGDEGDEEPIMEDDVFLKVGSTAKETEAFSFLQRSLFASYIKDVNAMQESVNTVLVEDITSENENEVQVLHSEDEEPELAEPVKSSELDAKQIAEKYGGVFFNYYYEMFLPNLLSSEYENIFLYPDIDEKVNEISTKRINIASCQLYVSTKFTHFMMWFVGLVTTNIPERKKKTTVVLDSFVLGQLEIGNLLSRKLTITMNDIETHVMVKDHDSGKYIGNRYQDERETLLFKLEDVELQKEGPMYPVEFVSMVEKGKLVKLHKMENLNVQVSLKVSGAEAGISYLNMTSLESFSRVMLQPTNFETSLTYSLLPDTFETKTPCIQTECTFKCNRTAIMFTKIQALLFYLISMSWLDKTVENEINMFVNSVFHAGDTTKDPSPLMNIDVEGITFRVFDMADLRGMSGVITNVLATLQAIGKDGKLKTATILQAPFNTDNLHDTQTWFNETESVQDSAQPFIQFQAQVQKENCKLMDTAVPLFGMKVGGATINFDHLLHSWLTYFIDGTMRQKSRVERQRSSITQSMSMTTSTQRRTKSYARVLGGSTEVIPQIEESENEKGNSVASEHYAEWITKKMNFFKAFLLQVDVKSIVIVLPTDSWPLDHDTSYNFVQMVGKVYKDGSSTVSPNSLVLCLPKLTLNSSSEGIDIFEHTLPMIFKQSRKNKETFPWTITSKDLTLFTLFSEEEDMVMNEKIETVYILKPVSWNICLASTSQNNAVSKSIASLGIIPEASGDGSVTSPGRVTRASIVQEKVGHCLSGKHVLGFVLHMDWSVCECFLSLKQLQLVSEVISHIYNTWNSMPLEKAVRKQSSLSLAGSTASPMKKDEVPLDRQSQSTASIIDRAEGMSTITDSSSVFPCTKGSPDCIDVSLWIQCTLPKVKCTILSHSDDALYQVISEIDEIMFAFDYQDTVLELTNKIAACIVYYSLLRFDTQPDGWTVMDNNYLLCQSEKYRSTHVDSKTLLSIVYRRTQEHSQSIMSPDESESCKKESELCKRDREVDRSSSVPICIQEEDITKHELNVNILPLDLICFTKPILSSLNIFVQILPNNSESPSPLEPETSSSPPDNSVAVMTLPSLDVHCDSVRIIIPIGEVVQRERRYSCIDNTETVFLFHFQSFDLHSSPVNPISKTVTDRVMYRQIKQSYRDVLKRLKLWNVQYQVDLSNIGLCTTNWQSLESSLPGKFAGLQNPALEWNSHPGYGQQVMTPIFPGFDFKATIAPPIISRTTGMMYPVTAAAFDFHSPKEVKVFINSSQIELALNFVKEINSLVLEVTRIMQHALPTRKESHIDEVVLSNDEIQSSTPYKVKRSHSYNATTAPVIPCLELFSSVSSISICVYIKEFKQPLISTIYPAFYINVMQPTISFTSVKETKFQLKVHDMDLVSSSDPKGINSESPVPLPGDFDLPLFSCGVGCVDEKNNSTPVLLDASASFETLDNITLNVCFEKPMYFQYNVLLDQNIKLFINNISKILADASIPVQRTGSMSSEVFVGETRENPLLKKSSSVSSSASAKESPILKVTLATISAKRVNASLSVSENAEDVSVNVQYQNLNCSAGLIYSADGLDSIDVKSKFDGVEVYFECGNNTTTLLKPANLKVDAFLKFCLHSGNNLHKSLLPKIFLFAQCGLMQLHANQHLYRLINDLSSKMAELLPVDKAVDNGNLESSFEGKARMDGDLESATESVPAHDNGVRQALILDDSVSDLITSEDDLRNGSFEYVVMKDDEMVTPLENQIVFTNDHYSYSPLMTWKYPQARVITDISLLPVPFHVSREHTTESGKLPCLLQYWDEINMSYVACHQFFVYESESSDVTIVDPKKLENADYCCAQVWRVVIGVSDDVESDVGDAEEDEEEDEDVEGAHDIPQLSVVPASSLVACMKVDSIYAAKLVPSLETNISISKLSIMLSNSLSSLGKGSPSDLSPFYIDEDMCYPDLIEAIELCFEDLRCSGSVINNMKVLFNLSSRFQFNVMDFNNLCWLRFLNSSPVNLWMKQLLAEDIALDKMSINLDIGATEMFVTQTAVHTLTSTGKAWSNLLSDDPEFLVFNHYVLCNETDEILHLQQMNTEEDITLQSGQMYPYSWCSKRSKSLRFCLESTGDWKWSEPIELDQVGVFPRRLDHKKFTSVLFVEVKKISGIQSQVIFHGSCSFLNNLDFDIKLSLVTQQKNRNALHAPVVNVDKEFIIPAGTSRPSVTISPSYIKSVGISRYKKDPLEENDEPFVISVPHQEDDIHFTVQIQNGTQSLLCWLSFDYTSTIFGQLVVTVSPKFIFRNHFPFPVTLQANARDSSESVEMTIGGKGHETQVFTLFPEKWFNITFLHNGNPSTTAFPINSTMHKLLKDNNYFTDFELKNGNWPFLQGTRDSSVHGNDQKVCFKQVETGEITVPSLPDDEVRCKVKCFFQATLPWLSLPSIVVDVKPHVLLTNVTDVELFVKSGDYVSVVKVDETIAPLHLQKELMLGMYVNGIVWSTAIALETPEVEQQPKQKILSPDTVTHCSIMDPNNAYCYQFSFTCKVVYGMVSVTIHKRFKVHNLSDYHLIMSPLIFTEFKGEKVFENLCATKLPPKSASDFYLLNSYTPETDQIPDGMAMNFQLSPHGQTTETVSGVGIFDYKFKEADSLLLTKEHLRETILLLDADRKPYPFVLTSSLDNGVVHIFIDEDVSVAVTLQNRSPLNLLMKEVNPEELKKNVHAEVLSADVSSLFRIYANSLAFYQPVTFKDNFPKTDNKLELNCQFALYSEDAAELSQPITIEKDKNCKLFVPNHGEIYVKSYINNSKLYIELNTVEDDTIAVSLNHLTLPLFNTKLSSIDVVLVDYSNHEKMVCLLSASLTRIELNHLVTDQNSVFKLTCGFMQVDNQVTGTLDHFPVLFLPMRQVSERYHSMTQDMPFSELEACLEADFFSLTFEVSESHNRNGNTECFVNNIRINMQPCEMYIEDAMIYRLANVFNTYLPRFSTTPPNQIEEVKCKCLAVLHPIRLCNIEIGEISILLSFHASIKVFLAADHIPLVFSRFKLMSTQTIMKEFVRSILYNYATQALVRVGWILGSLNIIGSPTGLIQSIGNGLSDFFVLPYNGLIRGPSAFVSGISLGMSSLMRHVSTGALTSLNNVTSSISRNMDRLSFDDQHLIMQEESRAESPTKVSKGFSKAFETLGMSLLGAVAGIVDHPIQNITEANTTSEAISGVATGFAKGIVGMFTKPIGGAMEFVSQASQGILQGAGLVRVPERVFLLDVSNLEKILLEESQMKYMWQYLHSESYAQILVVPNTHIKTSGDEKVKSDVYNGALILSDTALLVYNSQTNQVASVFPLKEVELLKLDDPESYKLQIYKHTSEQQFGPASLDENPNFRQFFDSFRDAAVVSHTEVLCDNLSSKNHNAVLEVELNEIYGELLITLCQTKKIKLLEEAYVLDCVDL